MNVLEKLLFNLQTIASIPSGKRISNAKEFIVIDEDSALQWIWRKYHGDSRVKAVQTICDEVRTVIAFSKYILESRYLEKSDEPEYTDVNCDVVVINIKPVSKRDERIIELKKISSVLTETNFGIDNIIHTYESDTNVRGGLQPLTGEIKACVSLITQKLIELGEFSK